MRFFKDKGKQVLDLSGNFIISKNDALISSNAKSCAPRTIKSAHYSIGVHKMGLWSRIFVIGRVARFVFPNILPVAALVAVGVIACILVGIAS